jgi:hypothetical protein
MRLLNRTNETLRPSWQWRCEQQRREQAERDRQGAAAYRNARDWAREKRDEFIEAANKRAPDVNAVSESLISSLNAAESVSTSRLVADSEKSVEELALEDDEISTSFSKRVRKETPDYDRGKLGEAVRLKVALASRQIQSNETATVHSTSDFYE